VLERARGHIPWSFTRISTFPFCITPTQLYVVPKSYNSSQYALRRRDKEATRLCREQLTMPITVPIDSVSSAWAVWTNARGEKRRTKKAKSPKARPRPERCLAIMWFLLQIASFQMDQRKNEEKETKRRLRVSDFVAAQDARCARVWIELVEEEDFLCCEDGRRFFITARKKKVRCP